jgi:type I restriction enzyme S subunit
MKKVKLRDLCYSNKIGLYGIPAPAEDYSEKKVRYLRISDINDDGTINDNDMKSVSDNDIERYILEENDIVFARTGNSTGRAYVYDRKDGIFAFAGFLIKYGLNPDKVNPLFLRYFTISRYYKQWVKNLSVGSTRGNISAQTFADCPIILPDRKVQDSLSVTLSLLDRKIAINRAINRNLEAMAKQLYDYWFVQFDFPDKNGKPYKSSGGKMVWNEKLKREIPEGWFAKNICSIAEILSGGTPSKQNASYWKNGTIPFFGPTDCNGNMFQISTAECITEDGLANCSSLQYDNGTIIITARGSIGKLVIVGTPMAMNQSCYALKSVRGQYEYLYFLTVQLIEHLKAKGGGSVFKSIITSDIENSILCIASPDVIDNFTKAVHHIFLRIKFNTEEIAELTKQRDELLPLLMNGQVTVTPPAVNCDL